LREVKRRLGGAAGIGAERGKQGLDGQGQDEYAEEAD